MGGVPEQEIEAIRKMVEAEFPEDAALQQVHIARKIIAREAEREGLSYIEYVKSTSRKSRGALQGHEV